jgi:hypothetical protein
MNKRSLIYLAFWLFAGSLAGACSPAAATPVVAIHKDQTVTVELDAYSGQPNPTWTLTPAEISELTGRISGLKISATTPKRAEILGYRGFNLQVAPVPEGGVQTIWAYRGLGVVASATRVATYLDPQRGIELWLLGTVRPPLMAIAYAVFESEIKKMDNP